MRGFSGFVAVNIEDFFDFGILGVVFLRPDFDNEGDIVKLGAVLDHKDAGNMRNCRKLAIGDFDSLRVRMIQVQPVSPDGSGLRAVNDFQVQLQIPAVIGFVCLDFGTIDNDRMPTNRKPANALRRVKVVRVERLDKLRHDFFLSGGYDMTLLNNAVKSGGSSSASFPLRSRAITSKVSAERIA